MIERQFNKTIKILRSDNGGEYTNKLLQTYLSNNGITHQFSCPYTPEQNGLAERKHRHILETTRTLMLTANLPHNLWPDIMLTAVSLINLLPSPVINNNTPHLLLHQKPPSYSHLKTIGCLCFPWLRHQSPDKLSPRSVPCILLGYAQHHKGYTCFDPHTHRIYISRHVRFCENIFPYKDQPTPQTQPPSPSQHHPPLTLIPSSVLHPLKPLYPTHSTTTTPTLPTPTHTTTSHTHPTDSFQITPPNSSVHIPPPPTTNQHPMLTRSRTGKSTPKTIFDLSHTYNPPPTPSTYTQAAKLPHWQQAMTDEIQALLSQNTWELVPCPSTQNVIGCRWTYKTKLHSDGTIARHKARLVAQGYTQTHGLDYHETFNPVAKFPTIRTLLTVATVHNWPILQLDISNAFLYGSLSETIYMAQPPGFQDQENPNHVCLLKKALYGLK